MDQPEKRNESRFGSSLAQEPASLTSDVNKKNKEVNVTNHNYSYKTKKDYRFLHRGKAVDSVIYKIFLHVTHDLTTSSVFETFWDIIDIDYCFTILNKFCFALKNAMLIFFFGSFVCFIG